MPYFWAVTRPVGSVPGSSVLAMRKPVSLRIYSQPGGDRPPGRHSRKEAPIIMPVIVRKEVAGVCNAG